MNCKLCRKSRELKKSHIIPEFLYEAMYDDIHRFHVLSVVPNEANTMLQKGLREKLLCADCESKLSLWERYASLVLKGGVSLDVIREGDLITISNIDYVKFKLFQLSILWRASISTLDFFSHVNLGKYEEVLRTMLENGEAGLSDDFGCIMYGLKSERVVTDLIVQPAKLRMNNIVCYRFVFGGFQWVYMVSKQTSSKYKIAFLQPTGRCVFLIKDILEAKYLHRFGKELNRLGRLSKI
jgi:hypothetical protein